MVKILFIDDDHMTLDLMKHVAEICGYNAVNCSSGKEALTLAVKELPDIIMLDLNLQDIHGTKVIEQLRKKRKIAKTPIIMLTAEKIFEEDQNKRLSGADGYIQKPLRLAELPEIVNKYVNHK